MAANYRAACRGRSAAEFFAYTYSICVEEADEVLLGLELLSESNILPEEKLADLKQEYLEILSALAKSRKTVSTKE